MKILLAMRGPAGGYMEFSRPDGTKLFGMAVHKYDDGSQLYVVVLDVEAAFTVEEESP